LSWELPTKLGQEPPLVTVSVCARSLVVSELNGTGWGTSCFQIVRSWQADHTSLGRWNGAERSTSQSLRPGSAQAAELQSLQLQLVSATATATTAGIRFRMVKRMLLPPASKRQQTLLAGARIQSLSKSGKHAWPRTSPSTAARTKQSKRAGGRRPLKARPRRAVAGPGPGRPRPAGQGSPPS
jgi:hypothetical protein